MTKIKTVIFDVGGVLHETNSALAEDLSKELGLSSQNLDEIWHNQIAMLGLGEITESEFWRSVVAQYSLRPVSVNEDLLGRSFKSQLKSYEEVKLIASSLKKLGINIAILSNTIEPHARVLREIGLYDDFKTVLLSHEIGIRKPDPNIYKYALEVLDSSPSQTVFIDDDLKNVKAAKTAGIHGIHFVDPGRLLDSLRQLIPEI